MTFSYGPFHMNMQVLDDQLEPIYNDCMDTGCSLEDMPEAMDDRDKRQARERGKSMLAAQLDRLANTSKWRVIWPVHP